MESHILKDWPPRFRTQHSSPSSHLSSFSGNGFCPLRTHSLIHWFIHASNICLSRTHRGPRLWNRRVRETQPLLVKLGRPGVPASYVLWQGLHRVLWKPGCRSREDKDSAQKPEGPEELVWWRGKRRSPGTGTNGWIGPGRASSSRWVKDCE